MSMFFFIHVNPMSNKKLYILMLILKAFSVLPAAAVMWLLFVCALIFLLIMIIFKLFHTIDQRVSFLLRTNTNIVKKSNIMEIIEVKRERDAYSIEWWSWRNFNEKLCLDLAWKWNFWCFFQSHRRKTKQKHLFSVVRGMSKVMLRKTEKVNKNIKKLKYTDTKLCHTVSPHYLFICCWVP